MTQSTSFPSGASTLATIGNHNTSIDELLNQMADTSIMQRISSAVSLSALSVGPAAGCESVGPAASCESVGPAAGRESVGPAAGRESVGPAAGRLSVGPSARPDSVGPAAGRESVGPAAEVKVVPADLVLSRTVYVGQRDLYLKLAAMAKTMCAFAYCQAPNLNLMRVRQITV